MILRQDCLDLQVLKATEEELAWLRAFTTLVVPGKPGTITTAKMYGQRGRTIPAGLRALVEQGTREAGIPCTVLDGRTRPVEPLHDPPIGWLRPYQREAVQRVVERERGIVWIGTGGGKGSIIQALTIAIPCRWVILVHRIHLLADLSQRYKAITGKEPGMIGEGVWNPREVTFATLATLNKALGRASYTAFAANVQGVVCDEAHCAAAAMHYRVIRSFPNAYWWCAMSATPLSRGDGLSVRVIGAFGPVIHRTTPEELITLGYLAKPRIRTVELRHDLSMAVATLPWQDFYQEVIVENPRRLAVIQQIVARARKPTMVFVTSIAHGEVLTKLCRANNYRTLFVEGANSLDERESVKRALAERSVDVVVATTVFSEGVDIPGLASVVLASGGKCLAPDTSVLAHDGRVVPASTVQVGDLLMGPDSAPRRVLTVVAGADLMYRVVPTMGEPWVCSRNHVLTVSRKTSKPPYGHKIIDIQLVDFAASRTQRRFKLFPVGVTFPPRLPVPIDPYFLGLWFGDGTKNLRSVEVSKPDDAVRDSALSVAATFGLRVEVKRQKTGAMCPTYRLVRRNGTPRGNTLTTLMRKVVGDASELPFIYLTSSREERLLFLAGLLDSDGSPGRDGHGYVITQKRRAYADGICFLANSLGLRGTTKRIMSGGREYWTTLVSGDCRCIPMRIPRKLPRRGIRKRPGHTSFQVIPIGIGAYAGFTVDGDGRFLLGDFTVTHNSSIAAIQRVGRAMRAVPGKLEGEVWDVSDTGHTTLDHHTRLRHHAFQKEGYTMESMSLVDLAAYQPGLQAIPNLAGDG